MKTININKTLLTIRKGWKLVLSTEISYFSYLCTSIKYWCTWKKSREIILLSEDQFYHNWNLKNKKKPSNDMTRKDLQEA